MTKKDVIIACDFKSMADYLGFLDKFGAKKPFLKIGMELFYSEGADVVREAKKRGHRVFLDLKLHDIPNTVEKSMRALARLGVDITNVHAAGTIEMMKAAKRGLSDGAAPLLIAVTQLTSTDEQRMRDELLINSDMPSTVSHYAKNAKQAGLDGVVCSPLEAELVKSACGSEFLTVTPGIRYPEGSKGDQVRVTTPAQARAFSDFIVVGRPITAADDPVAAYARVCRDFLGE